MAKVKIRFKEVEELLASRGYKASKTNGGYLCQGHTFRNLEEFYTWAQGLPKTKEQEATDKAIAEFEAIADDSPYYTYVHQGFTVNIYFEVVKGLTHWRASVPALDYESDWYMFENYATQQANDVIDAVVRLKNAGGGEFLVKCVMSITQFCRDLAF